MKNGRFVAWIRPSGHRTTIEVIDCGEGAHSDAIIDSAEKNEADRGLDITIEETRAAFNEADKKEIEPGAYIHWLALEKGWARVAIKPGESDAGVTAADERTLQRGLRWLMDNGYVLDRATVEIVDREDTALKTARLRGGALDRFAKRGVWPFHTIERSPEPTTASFGPSA